MVERAHARLTMTWTWLLSPLGVTNVSGRPYAWWSGSGSVILPPLITLAGISALYAWHHQCRERGCVRVVRHAEPGKPRYCHRHPREPLKGDA